MKLQTSTTIDRITLLSEQLDRLYRSMKAEGKVIAQWIGYLDHLRLLMIEHCSTQIPIAA